MLFRSFGPADGDSKVLTQEAGEYIEAYDYMHEIAVNLGYPSILEALEHLSELRSPSDDVKRLREALERIEGLDVFESGLYTAQSIARQALKETSHA